MPWLVGSVGWVPVYRLKGRWFDSWSGHMPELCSRSPAGGVEEETDRCFSCTSMFPFLPFLLSKNKKNEIKSLKKHLKKNLYPWLVWFSGLRATLWTRRLPVQFPVRAHAWIASQVVLLLGGTWEATTHWYFSLFLFPFPSL